jgi:hypothetical protein
MGSKNGKPVLRGQDIAEIAKATGHSAEEVNKLVMYSWPPATTQKR